MFRSTTQRLDSATPHPEGRERQGRVRRAAAVGITVVVGAGVLAGCHRAGDRCVGYRGIGGELFHGTSAKVEVMKRHGFTTDAAANEYLKTPEGAGEWEQELKRLEPKFIWQEGDIRDGYPSGKLVCVKGRLEHLWNALATLPTTTTTTAVTTTIALATTTTAPAATTTAPESTTTTTLPEPPPTIPEPPASSTTLPEMP